MNEDFYYLIRWPFKSKRLPFFSTKSFWSSKRRRGSYFCILACTGTWSASVSELEDAIVAEELETVAADEELAGFIEELLDTAEELCGTLEEYEAVAELEATEELDNATEELLICSEELEAGVSFLATPLTANSGAWPALSASSAPAR